MKKSEAKFNRNAKDQIDSNARISQPNWWSMHNPIYIPKRKKFKR